MPKPLPMPPAEQPHTAPPFNPDNGRGQKPFPIPYPPRDPSNGVGWGMVLLGSAMALLAVGGMIVFGGRPLLLALGML